MLLRQVGGILRYLYAVQLLGQDAEKIIGEVAQQRWVPVPIAPLAGRGRRAQHINTGGRKVTMRKEQSGPNTGVLAHHTRILLRMAFLLLTPSTASSTKAQGSSSSSPPGLG